MEIEDKLTALIDDAEFQKIDQRLRRFNLFEAIGTVTGELKHSNFLAFILSPARPHGLGTEFLLRILRAILGKIPAEERAVGTLELIMADLDRTVIHRERDNIDLLIEIKEIGKERGLVVAIENKVDADVGDGQLARNKEIVQQRFKDLRHVFVLLTPQGQTPEDSAYVPLGYGEVAGIIEKLLTDRGEALSPELSFILRHYVEMLRRNNIVQDEKLVEQARRLYEKHKEAFDFVSQCQPRPANLLVDIRQLLNSNATLIQDNHIASILRFAVVEWGNVPRLNSCPPSEWTKTGRSLLFEIKAHEDNRISLALVLGPSDDPRLREQIYSEAAKKKGVFLGLVKPMGRKWSQIYSTPLLTALEAKEMSHQEQIEAIQLTWQKFVAGDLGTLTKAILELVGRS